MDTYELHSRVGKFSIKQQLVRDEPEKVMRLMNNMIVIRCELLYHTLSFEYIAMSPSFEKVKEGDPIPGYILFEREDWIEIKRAYDQVK